MSRKPYREQYLFWLDLADDEQYQIAEQITELKQQRQYASAIRDGIRLIVSLRQGRTEVLFALFPWLQYQQPQQPTAPRHVQQPAPVFQQQEEEPIELEMKKDTSATSAKNFLSSMLSLQEKNT